MKKNIFYFVTVTAFITSLKAQENLTTKDTTSIKLINLNEVIFSANKAEENKSDVPYMIDIIKAKDLELSNPQTSADMLSNTGNIMVQKSQAGGGSPIIRGFEANRVLIVVDGVRMNNAIYRAGHLQDVITIDNSMLDRTEIVYGPSSVIYGSDALGGVMHFYTKNPLFGDEKMNFKLNSYLRYSSANKEKTGHVDFNLGFKKLASLTSINFSDFDDLRSGYARTPNAEFGRCNYYVGSNLSGTADSMIRNTNSNIQKKSGYSQIDFMEKLLFKANDKVNVGLNLQYSSSSEINRYDRLTDYSGANLKYAENGYGPQKRTLLSIYSTIKSDGKLFDNMRITAAYQDVAQERFNRKFSTSYTSASSSNNKTVNLEKVNVYSLNVDLRKKIKEKHELSYGVETVANKVISTATKTNIYTGANITPVDTRYPNGGSKTTNVGAYLSHSLEINEKLILTDGIRFTYNSLTSTFDTAKAISSFQFPYTSVKQTNNALNGNLGLVIMPEQNIRFTILGSTGFRAPNVDDMSRVYESAGSSVVVPNAKLKAEYAYNIEGGVATTVLDNRVKFEATYNYTLLKNAIVMNDFQYNGKDSLMFNGVMSKVKASQNVDEAFIQGLFGAITADLTDHFSFKTTITYTIGQYHKKLTPLSDDANHDTIIPLDHIPPIFGQTGLMYHFKKFDSEIYARYSAPKSSKDYSLGAEDNESYSADVVNGYMPGWVTFNIKTAYHVTENATINLGVENLFDTHYRLFASGISAPGRNLMVAVRVKF